VIRLDEDWINEKRGIERVRVFGGIGIQDNIGFFCVYLYPHSH
jgi:hypothetical protein